MMPKLPGIVVVALLLTACQQMPILDENSEFSRIVPGSRIVLYQDLTVPTGHARVFLQNGRVMGLNSLNQYYPHCDFEVRDVSDGALQVHAGTFIVTRVTTGEAMVVQRKQGFMRASFAPDGDQTVGMVSPYVHHQLHAEGQPELMRMTCHGGFAQQNVAIFPSVKDIRKALGGIATVEVVRAAGR